MAGQYPPPIPERGWAPPTAQQPHPAPQHPSPPYPPATPPSATGPRNALVAAAAVGVLLLLGTVVFFVTRSNVSVFDLAVGQCVEFDDDDELEKVTDVDCTQPHTAEVYALPRLRDPAGDPYPGAETVTAFAQDECVGAFAGYVGISYEQSALSASWLTPTADSWARNDDREVVCLLVSLDGSPLTGAKRDSRE